MDRVLNAVIYDYKNFKQKNNWAALDHERVIATRKGVSNSSMTSDYSRLERFLKMIKRSGATLIVVAFPQLSKNGKYPYGIDPKIRLLVESYGFVFKDLRQVKGLESGMYRDDIHLTAEGREIYTRALAYEVSRALSGSKAGRGL